MKSRKNQVQRVLMLLLTLALLAMSMGFVNASTNPPSSRNSEVQDQSTEMEEFHVSNGYIKIKLSEFTENIYSRDFSFTKKVNDGSFRSLRVSNMDWDKDSRIATFSFLKMSSGKIEQEITIGVSYKGGSVHTASFTIAQKDADVAELEINNHSPDETLTVGSRKDSSLKLSAVAADKNGSEITGKKIVWSSSNKRVVTVDRLGNVKAVGKGTAVIKARIGETEDSLEISVKGALPKFKSISAINGIATVVFTDTPEEDPQTNDFTLSIQIDRASQKRVTITDFIWDDENRTVHLWFDEIAATDKDQRIVITVDYRGEIKKAKQLTIAKAAGKAYKVTIKNYGPDNKLTVGSSDDHSLRLQAVVLDRAGHLITGKNVGWTSENTSVAQVDENGTVTAVGEGIVRIRAAIDRVSSTFTVRVSGPVVRPSITLSSSMIRETQANDGSVAETLSVNLKNGKYSEDITAADVDVSNLPQGLGIGIERENDMELIVSFTGKAENHRAEDSRDNLRFVVDKSKVQGAVEDVSSEPFSLRFYDPIIIQPPPLPPLPTSLAQGVAFADTDMDQGEIAGDLTWNAASDEGNLTSYVIYFLDNQDDKAGSAITAINKGDPYLFAIPTNTAIPTGAAKIGVFSKNKRGESNSASTIALIDAFDRSTANVEVAQPGVKMEDLSFNLSVTGAKDSSGADLDGTLKVTVAANDGTKTTTVVDNQDIVFAAGAATIPVTITEPGLYSLEVSITGVQGTKNVSNVQVAEGEFASGQGTSADPYVIRSVNQLNHVRDHLSSHFVLLNDIDLNVTPHNAGEGWVRIGDSVSSPFQGTFDGNGKTIRNLYINRPISGSQALFGILGNGGIVKNIGIENANVRALANGAGLVGVVLKGGLVSDGSVTGVITGDRQLGGIAGFNYGGTITDSQASVTITGVHRLGGLVGNNWGIISKSHVTGGVVQGNFLIGGLTGLNYSDYLDPARVYATIERSSSEADIVGVGSNPYLIGGLVGQSGGGIIINSYATGVVNGHNQVGGLVGESGDFIGIAGIVENSYATGLVTGTQYVGGLIGKLTSGEVRSSYYDSMTSGQNDVGKGTPKSTTEMEQEATFMGWDFVGIWNLPSGSYPQLW